MPLPLQYKLPVTANPDEFEDMVVDYYKENYKFAQRYGRKGQKQDGIDIIIRCSDSNDSQSFIAVQCKNCLPDTKELAPIINLAATGDICSK